MSFWESESCFNGYFGYKEDGSNDDDPIGRLYQDEYSRDSNSQLITQDSFLGQRSEDECDAEFEEDITLDKQYISALDDLSSKIIHHLHQIKENKVCTERRLKQLVETKDKPQPRKNWYHLFGSPYFKDKTFYPCPGNEDFYEKLEKNEINYHELPPVRRWKACDQQRLEEAVKNNLIEIRSKELKMTKDVIVKKLKTEILTSEEDNLKLELQNLDLEIMDVENKTMEDLLERNSKELDWLRISAVDFDGQRTSEELKAMWDFCLQPCISKRNWSQEENKRLAEIAEKHNLEDWDDIAKELNTKRSGFQCFVQYQRNLNRNLKKSKWTKEEDNNLKRIIQECRVGDFIPWSKVALQMNGRTKVQVYNRWTYSIDPMIRKGRFTPEEDCLIVAGVQRFGKDFPRISRFLPGRTSIQIRDRFIGSLQKVGPISRWTKEEDQLLLELVEKFGTKSWNRISSHFSDRYRCQVRHRYLTLKKWLAKFPDLSQQYSPRQYVGDYCNLQANLWSRVQSILKSSLKIKESQRDKKTSREEEILSLKRRLNMVNSRKSGRKSGSAKQLTSAEILLSKHYMNRMDEVDSEDDSDEQVQEQKKIIPLLLQFFNTQLSFSSEEKILKEDKRFKASDKDVLIALKNEYEEKMNHMHNSTKILIKPQKDILSKELQTTPSIFTKAEGDNNNEASFHLSDEAPDFHFPFYLPPSIGTIRGVVMWNNVDLRFQSQKKEPEVESSPSERHYDLKRLSPEVSRKLLKQRIDALFGWTVKLKGCKPPDAGNVFGQEMDSSYKNTDDQNCHYDDTTTTAKKANLSRPKKSTTKRTRERKNSKADDHPQSSQASNTSSIGRKRRPTKEKDQIKTKLKCKQRTKEPSRRSTRIAELQKIHM